MTAVVLDRLWLNDAADPADAIAVPVWIDSTRTWSVPGEVREYAGGVRRLVTRAGDPQTWAPQLGIMPLPLAEALVARRGRAQWVRDPVGGRVRAVFLDPALTLAGYADGVQSARVTLSLLSLGRGG